MVEQVLYNLTYILLMCTSFCVNMFSILLGTYLGTKSLHHRLQYVAV
jgi:hypothetical protein